jgi:hypothetical protein
MRPSRDRWRFPRSTPAAECRETSPAFRCDTPNTLIEVENVAAYLDRCFIAVAQSRYNVNAAPSAAALSFTLGPSSNHEAPTNRDTSDLYAGSLPSVQDTSNPLAFQKRVV